MHTTINVPPRQIMTWRAGARAAVSHGLLHGHLARWVIAVILACVIVVVVLRVVRYGFRRVRYGRHRPWLKLWVRLRWHLNPGPGFASDWAVWRRHGLPAARRVARRARPSLSWWGRRIGTWRSYAAFVGWAQGWVFRRRVYASLESLRLVIAPPQEGKSAEAAGTILDAPGAVVATSIRGDLIAATAGMRAGRGQIHVWNPEGVGDYGSTFSWNPAEGCQDMVTAVRRAGYMVEATTARGLSDERFWSDQASMTLAAYLHAAGLAGGDLRHVYRWVLSHDDQPARILSRHPAAADTALTQVRQYLSLPERTRAGVSTTINSVLKFMQHPAIVASLTPAAGEGFDFEEFLQGRDTLYLVASDAQTSPVPPLFVAICAEVTDVARQVGAVARPARPPRGTLLGSAGLGSLWDQAFPPPTVARLDPPLTMVLDEVANIAPVPVAAWATWAAGSGIWLHLYAQAWAQLVERWGEHGAMVIWQACKCKVVYTGTSEPELCRMVEDLCGSVRVRGPDSFRYSRRGKLRRQPTRENMAVLPMATVRQLPPGRAVVIQASAPPTIVRTEQVWRRDDYRAWRRYGTPVSLPAPAERVIPAPIPALMVPPAGSRWLARADERAARRDRSEPGKDTAAPAAGHDASTGSGADDLPAAAPESPPSGRRPPTPPSRPAPWARPAGEEELKDDQSAPG
jgi:type IV secretion system protein VirD4